MIALHYFIAVSDGASIRTIHPPALGDHRAAVEAALAAVLGVSGDTLEGIAMTAIPLPPARKLLGPAKGSMLTQGELARVQGFTGDSCSECGGFSMRRNGTCLLCTDCGATTGCS